METTDMISLREAFGQELAEQGKNWPDLVVLDAGTSNSTYSHFFAKKFPERFFNAGINEPGMVGLATGMAMAGKRVVACDMSVFLQHAYAHLVTAGRQGNIHLIIAASHTGITVGPDGASAQDITDLSRMRLIPGFTIVAPWDGDQTKEALRQMLAIPGLYYLRLNRPPLPLFLAPYRTCSGAGSEKLFEKNWLRDWRIGPAYLLKQGQKVTLVAIGDKVFSALAAAEELGQDFAEVIGILTLEPLDQKTIIDSAIRTGRVVTVEDHMFIGGLFEAVAGVLAQHCPVPIKPLALPRVFTTSGEPEELLKLYQLDKELIIDACRNFGG